MLLIADEMYFNLYGKVILQGIYNNDLVIPKDPSTAPQLIFYFAIETDIIDPFHSLNVEVTLPGAEPVRNIVFVLPPQLVEAQAKAAPERVRYYVRHPLLIPNPILRPGRIEAKAIHEKGEIPVSTQWITLAPTVPAKSS
jgi:hypothetical protein